ncbi:MAG: carboxylating nicotinate-nucleotide diphosphorylase [Nitrospinota bacterium]
MTSLNKNNYLPLIKEALKEDRYDDDISSSLTIDPNRQATGLLIAKSDLVLAGIEIFNATFKEVDPNIAIKSLCNDKDQVAKGETIAVIEGNARSILAAERVGLNFLQRMSGIATKSATFVAAIKGYPAKILDTRKTTPLLRILEKYSVVAGGAYNHRYDLSEMVLIKDNHIDIGGGITSVVNKVRMANKRIFIEVEVRTLEELAESLLLDINRILLDNMDINMTCEAVKLRANQIKLESSGSIDITNVRDYAKTGVDFISIGELTHSVKVSDISLQIKQL